MMMDCEVGDVYYDSNRLAPPAPRYLTTATPIETSRALPHSVSGAGRGGRYVVVGLRKVRYSRYVRYVNLSTTLLTLRRNSIYFLGSESTSESDGLTITTISIFDIPESTIHSKQNMAIKHCNIL